MVKQNMIESLREDAKRYEAQTVGNGGVWYAVMRDWEDDDLGTGSNDIIEAVEMAERMDHSRICVVDDGNDPIVMDEIEIDLEWFMVPVKAGDGKTIKTGDVLTSTEGFFEVTGVSDDGQWVYTREQIPTEEPDAYELGEELPMTKNDAKHYRHA